jgi:hypothetical protein
VQWVKKYVVITAVIGTVKHKAGNKLPGAIPQSLIVHLFGYIYLDFCVFLSRFLLGEGRDE